MGAFYNLKSGFIGWFGNIKLYKHPFFVLLGHAAYKIKGQHMREILNILEPGDILLRRYDHYISGLMIPGYFTHGALYSGDNMVTHLLGQGITVEDILVFTRCDDIAIIRCTDPALVNEALTRSNKQVEKGVEYDYDFNTESPDRLYCTEFTAYCYQYPKMIHKKKGLILPDDHLSLPEFGPFKLVWRKK